MQLIKHIFNKHRIEFLALGVFVIFFVFLKVSAVSGGPFTQGETLNPDCYPSDTNCIVKIFPTDAAGSLKNDGVGNLSWASVFPTNAIGALKNDGVGNLSWASVFPTNAAGSLKNDGSGNLSWATVFPTNAAGALKNDGSGNLSWGAAGTTITGLTQNYLSKSNAAGDNIVNSQIFDDGTNVGIGINPPTAKLHVRAINNGLFLDGDTGFTQIGFRAQSVEAGSLRVYTGRWEVTTDRFFMMAQSGSAMVIDAYANGAIYTSTASTGLLSVGAGYSALAKLQVRGSTSDNTAYALKIDNSTPTEIISARNDGLVLVNGLTVGKGSGFVYENTTFGTLALNSNTTGLSNVAIGLQTLRLNTTGNYNTAIGAYALDKSNTSYNTAIGYLSQRNGTTAEFNTTLGSQTLRDNDSGSYNVAIGHGTLQELTTTSQNTAIGYYVLGHNNGSLNTALGYSSGFSNYTGSGNIFLGSNAGYYETGSNKLYIDDYPRSSESDGRAKSLIYGVFDANPANQTLQINAKTGVLGNLQVGDSGGAKGITLYDTTSPTTAYCLTIASAAIAVGAGACP